MVQQTQLVSRSRIVAALWQRLARLQLPKEPKCPVNHTLLIGTGDHMNPLSVNRRRNINERFILERSKV